MPDERPFMELTALEVWTAVRQQGDAIIEIRGEIGQLRLHGDDREKRIRKLELRYYAILAGIVTGFVGYAFTIAQSINAPAGVP